MQDGLYHRDVFFPPQVADAIAGKNYRLTLSNHALRACANDRYGVINPPSLVSPKANEIIEVEIQARKILKIVTRTPYDRVKDIIIVFIPKVLNGEMTGLVKTFWFNVKTDAHKTLDKTKYVSLK